MEFCRSWYTRVVVCCKNQWSNQCASLFVAPVLENESDKGAGLDYGMPLLADTACTYHCPHWHPRKDELHHLYTQHSPVILSLKMMLITGSIPEFSNSHIRLAVWSVLMLMIIELHIQYCPCLLLWSPVEKTSQSSWSRCIIKRAQIFKRNSTQARERGKKRGVHCRTRSHPHKPTSLLSVCLFSSLLFSLCISLCGKVTICGRG